MPAAGRLLISTLGVFINPGSYGALGLARSVWQSTGITRGAELASRRRQLTKYGKSAHHKPAIAIASTLIPVGGLITAQANAPSAPQPQGAPFSRGHRANLSTTNYSKLPLVIRGPGAKSASYSSSSMCASNAVYSSCATQRGRSFQSEQCWRLSRLFLKRI